MGASTPATKLACKVVIAPVSSARSVRKELIASASAALVATTSCSLDVLTSDLFRTSSDGPSWTGNQFTTIGTVEIKGPRPNLADTPHHEASAARLAMWNLVARSQEPLTAARAAELAHTHANTAADHLAGLHRSGVVRRVRHHAGGRE